MCPHTSESCCSIFQQSARRICLNIAAVLAQSVTPAETPLNCLCTHLWMYVSVASLMSMSVHVYVTTDVCKYAPRNVYTENMWCIG